MDKPSIDELNDYTVSIYKHPALMVCFENNYKSVKVTDDIRTGELLLIEHVYAAKTALCHLVIENNEALFNLYHPRISTYAETETKEKFNHAKNKLEHNCFGLANGDKLNTTMITNINHSCDPLCGVYIQEKYSMNDTNIIFMELYAVRNIKANTEITISYGPETAHNRDFECNCGKDLPARTKLFNIISDLSLNLSIGNNSIIKQKVLAYLDTPLSKKIMLNHYLSTKGIFIGNNKISAYTKDGEKTINDVIHAYMKLDGPIKSPTTGEIIEQTMNQHKINLFLQIVNQHLL